MSEWLNHAIAKAETIDDWLTPQRRASLQLLKQAQWPSREVEAWKYTSVRALENLALANAPVVLDPVVDPVAVDSVAVDSVVIEPIQNLDSIDVVFVAGKLQAIDPTLLPDGLSIVALNKVTGGNSDWVKSEFSSIKPKHHLFGLVNDVLAVNGVVVDVAANAKIDKAIRLVNVIPEGCETHVRVMVRVGEGASATVIEEFVGDAASSHTTVVEYNVGALASLEHYRFGLQKDRAIAIGGSHFKLFEKSRLHSTLVNFGSDLSRTNLDVEYAGEYAKAEINAIYLLREKELYDLHSTIEHAVPHCTTEENVRGIVADSSRAVFNGRIHIHRHAQKTLAELNNRNLLLSDKAEVDTKPELEIYADDVKCAHGATIAETDKAALYYLQTRGIDPVQAQIMLNFGFINELIEKMPNQVLADWLRPQLRLRFAEMQNQF